MSDNLKKLINKYREMFLYLLFGGLTTLVSWGIYFLFTRFFGLNYQVSQWISWVTAVAFAFIVNKLYVFADRDLTKNGLFRQIWQFVSVRIASGFIEYLLMLLMIEIIKISDDISKILVSIITVIINYIASKLLIFKKSDKLAK
jgi:putative flippase GtrA